MLGARGARSWNVPLGGACRLPWSARALAPGCSAHLPRALRGSERRAGGRTARTGGGDWAGGARRVTSRAPVPAAEIGQPRRRSHSSGQRRLREPEPRQPPGRRGPADSQRDRPKDAGPGRAAAAATGRFRLPRSGHLVSSSAPATSGTRVREGCQAAATNWSGCAPLGSQRPRPHVSHRARRRALVFSARAARVKFARLAGGGHRTTGYPGRGQDSGQRLGRRGLGPGSAVGTGVTWLARGARRRTAGAEAVARVGLRDPGGAALGRGTPSGLGEPG